MSTRRKSNKSVKALLAGAKRPQRVVTINTNGELLAKHQELEALLAEVAENEDRARLASKPEAVTIAEQIQQVELDSEEYLVDLTLEALPGKDWRAALALNPPSDEDRQKGSIADWNAVALAVLPQCCIDPQLDADDVDNIFGLSEGQWQEVAAAVWQVNRGDNAVPFSRIGSLYLPDSNGVSESPDRGESPSDDSKAGNPSNGSPSKPATAKAARLAG